MNNNTGNKSIAIRDSVTQRLRNKSQELSLDYNTLLSRYFFDEFLKLLAKSEYKNNFVLKGGMLLSFVLGIDNRSTQDIDFLINGLKMEDSYLFNVIKSVTAYEENHDGMWFEINDSIDSIRPEDEYGGYRFHIIGHLDKIRFPFSVDIATGDPMYPEVKVGKYSTVLGEDIDLQMYPLESVLAEKLQTILSKAESNTRSKDFYDIYAIMNSLNASNNGNCGVAIAYLTDCEFVNQINESIDFSVLKVAMSLTCKHRNTYFSKIKAREILECISCDSAVIDRWNRYAKKHQYAKSVNFEDVISAILKLINLMLD